MSFRTDMVEGRPVARAGGTDVWIYNAAPQESVIIEHGLGKLPTRVTIVDKDAYCDWARVSWDRYRAVFNFSVTNCNLVLHFE
jgi:hypothetical protein